MQLNPVDYPIIILDQRGIYIKPKLKTSPSPAPSCMKDTMAETRWGGLESWYWFLREPSSCSYTHTLSCHMLRRSAAETDQLVLPPPCCNPKYTQHNFPEGMGEPRSMLLSCRIGCARSCTPFSFKLSPNYAS